MPDPILDEIRPARELFTNEHGGLEGYFARVKATTTVEKANLQAASEALTLIAGSGG